MPLCAVVVVQKFEVEVGRTPRGGGARIFEGQLWDTKCPKWALMQMHGYAVNAREYGGKRGFA